MPATGPKTTKSIFGLKITNGIIGNFTINSTGDTNLTPITIYKQAGKNLVPVKTLIPAANLIGGRKQRSDSREHAGGGMRLPRCVSPTALTSWPPTSAHTPRFAPGAR